MNNSKMRFLLLLGMIIGLMVTGSRTASGQTDGNRASGERHSGWSVPFFGSPSRPVIHDGAVIVGSADGGVYAFDVRTGGQVWSFQTGENLRPYTGPGPTIVQCPPDCLFTLPDKTKGNRRIEATPVIRNDTVFVGSHDHHFYALDVKTGQLKWSTRLAGKIGWFGEEAFVTDQTVVVPGKVCCPHEETLYILDAEDGRIIWSTQGQGWSTNPASSDGAIYFALENDRYLDPEPGEEKSFVLRAVDHRLRDDLWSLELVGRAPGWPVFSDGVIFISALEGGDLRSSRGDETHIYAVDAFGGELLWDFSKEDITLDSSDPLTVGSEFVFVVTKKGLAAVSKSSGEMAWFLEGDFIEHEILLRKDLYVLSGDYMKKRSLFTIDRETGRVKWDKRVKGIWHRTLRDDVLYVSAEDRLVALDANAGRKLWTFRTSGFWSRSLKGNDRITAQPTLNEGQVMFPTHYKLINIDAETGKLKRK